MLGSSSVLAVNRRDFLIMNMELDNVANVKNISARDAWEQIDRLSMKFYTETSLT